MINPFILKKYLALTISAMVPLMCFYISSSYYGLYYGLGFLVLGLILSYIICSMLLKNPFTLMLEGRGFLTLDLSSTGIIIPFITNLNPKEKRFIIGRPNNKELEDIFDRNTVLQISEPIKLKKAMEEKDGILTIKLDKKAYNSARFSMLHYPVLIWNSQLNSLLTKDFLSDNEKSMFAEHTVLYLHQKTKQLIDASTNFGRHVVDLLKPKNEFLKSGWVWVIIIGALIVIAFMFAPKIVSMFQSQLGGTGVLENLNQPSGRLP